MGPYQNTDIAQQTADLLGGSYVGPQKQTDLLIFEGGGDDLSLASKTSISINVLTGTIAVTWLDENGAVLYTRSRTPSDSVINLQAFGNPVNEIIIQGDTAGDTCEIITSSV